MGWTKEPPFEGEPPIGCLNCGGTPKLAPMDMWIAVGFGAAYATKDGAQVYNEMDRSDEEEPWPLSKIEELAAADPDHDWRVVLHGALRGREYQRHGDRQWVLIHADQGFA